MKKCPICKEKQTVTAIDAEGFWEKTIFPLLILRPFRCSICWTKFYRFTLRNGALIRVRKEGKGGKASERKTAFLPPEDDRDFTELIRQIREKEKTIYNEGLEKRDGSPKQ